MNTITTVVTKTVDMDTLDMQQQYLARPLVLGNHLAHEFRLQCTRHGAKVDLTGSTVWGYVKRKDGVTVPMEGTASGNTASIILTNACYAVPGTVIISIDIAMNGIRATHAIWRATVLPTQTDLIGGDEVLSVGESIEITENAALRAEAAAAKAAATDAGILAARVDVHHARLARTAQKTVFQSEATLTDKDGNDISAFYLGAMLDLDIDGADPKKQYSFGTFIRADSYLYITIWDENYTIVCAYNVPETGATGRQVIRFDERNNSGMTARALIDFDVFAIGTYYESLIYQYCGIDSRCYTKTIREMDVNDGLSSLKHYEKKRGIFQASATLMSASGEDISEFLCGAIRDIYIAGAAPGETYAIGQITRDAANMVDIFIWDSAYKVVLVLHIPDASDYSGVQTFDLTEMDGSGMSGQITVDFDVLTVETNHRGMGLESTPIDSAYLFGRLREQKIEQENAKLNQTIQHCEKKTGIFQESATLLSAAGEDISSFLCGAIRDICIDGANSGETYAIGQISRDEASMVDIFIWDSSYTVVLALHIPDASGYAGVQTFDLSEMGSSGMSGQITVDFGVLTPGTLHRGMGLESTPIDDAYLFGSLREQKAEKNSAELHAALQHCKKKKGIFKESATLLSASGEDISEFMCGAIQDICIHGAVQGKTYAVGQIRWNAVNEVMINIWDSAYNYVAAAYIADASGYTGVMTLDLSELNASGMSGKITVDFDVLTPGADYSGMPIESTPINDAYLFGTLREQEMKNTMLLQRWEGKKWYALGDSFTEQNIYPHYLNQYCKFAAYYNAGWSGRNMKDMLTKLSQESTADYDLITVFCGTNDYGSGTALGAKNDSADTDSFYGHTRKVIETIIGQNPTARLCFFTPTIRGAFEDQPVYPAVNSAGFGLEAYADAIRDVCAVYAIPCCDTFRTSQFNPLTLSALTQDNLHPNDAGGKLLARQMQGFIEAL